jgi:large subunit GTPase 1
MLVSTPYHDQGLYSNEKGFLHISRLVARGFTRAGQGNPDEARAARYILKDYVDGKLLFCQPPPGMSGEDFNEAQQVLVLEALQRAGKKKAPTTRVTKDAATYTGPSGVPSGGAPGQSAKSKKLDDEFFADGTGLSDKPFTKGARGGDQAFVRMNYSHQTAIGNDGRPVEGGVQIPIPVGKKHYKGKKEKHRSGKGYD